MFKISILLSTLMVAHPAYAEVISDGSFENQGTSVASYCYDDACPSGAWSEKHFIHSGEPAWGYVAAKSGATYGFVQSTTASLVQYFSTPSTGSFVVSWWETGRPAFSGGGNQTVVVQINGMEVGRAVSVPGSSWALHYTNAFTLSAGQTYQLRLGGLATSDQTAFIDDVAVVPASATAASTVYSYDALGRLRTVSTRGGSNDGLTSNYGLDSGGNRTNVTTTGSH